MRSPRRPQGLSIVIPVYASGATIERALVSIIDALQKLSHTAKLANEIVVVFDGPDDESMAIVSEFQTGRWTKIRVFQNAHAGIATTRNFGLGQTAYSHVTFLDSDDEMTLARLSVAATRPKDVIIGHQAVVWDSISPPPGGVPDPRTSDGSPNPYITSLVARTETLLSVGGFRRHLVLSDDLDLVMRLRKAGHQLVFNTEVFVIRHVTGRNASLDYASLSREFFQLLREAR